ARQPRRSPRARRSRKRSGRLLYSHPEEGANVQLPWLHPKQKGPTRGPQTPAHPRLIADHCTRALASMDNTPTSVVRLLRLRRARAGPAASKIISIRSARHSVWSQLRIDRAALGCGVQETILVLVGPAINQG